METTPLLLSLERFPAVLEALVARLGPEEARWRPEPGVWSVIEIVRHMVDEEREDFRPRLTATLADPTVAWPAIDPEGWVEARAYQDARLPDELARFRSERARSVAWLRELEAPAWERAHDHPELGTLRAGDLLVSWTVHDCLHLRQITQRLYQAILHAGGPYEPDYAGRW